MTLLEKFCTAIRDYEGKPGDRNYRNNNPGNCRFSKVGYLKKYGNVTKDKDGFAIFPTYQLGWEYLLALVTSYAHLHPNWTIGQFMGVYAPTTDGNNPKTYSTYLTGRLGVSPSTTLRDLVS